MIFFICVLAAVIFIMFSYFFPLVSFKTIITNIYFIFNFNVYIVYVGTLCLFFLNITTTQYLVQTFQELEPIYYTSKDHQLFCQHVLTFCFDILLISIVCFLCKNVLPHTFSNIQDVFSKSNLINVYQPKTGFYITDMSHWAVTVSYLRTHKSKSNI